MSTSGGGKWLAVIGVWIVLIGAGLAVYWYFYTPQIDAEREYRLALAEYESLFDMARERKLDPPPPPVPADADAEQIRTMALALKERMTGSRAGTTELTIQVALALDSFSGYALFRSQEFKNRLRLRGIGLDLVDDGADYELRLSTLESGDTPLAVFTVDALIMASAKLKDRPATIVMLLDESTGADAMVAYEKSTPNIDALNDPNARLVVTPNSPSETLARVVMAGFNLPRLPSDPWIKAKDVADVFEKFQSADKNRPQAFVLWEPYVSKALEQPGAIRLTDSSRFTGYIIDVLVVQREFLLEHENVVRTFVESYLRTAYGLRQRNGALKALVAADAKQLGEPLTDQQAQNLVDGVWWKNTQENYAHLRLLPSDSGRALQPLDDMIRKLTTVLISTGAMTSDPSGGDPGKFYYDGILRRLQESQFHPNIVVGSDAETIRASVALSELSDAQWEQLAPVGTLKVARLVFARGTATLIAQSKRSLTQLVDTLQSWPQSYLLVQGHARAEGDPEANRLLAESRAKTAAEFLVAAGVSPQRVRAVVAPPGRSGGEAQSVTFVLGHLPY